MTGDESFLLQTSKRNLMVAPGKLEELGKILGKNMWVRAHSKENTVEGLLEIEIAPVELNILNERKKP